MNLPEGAERIGANTGPLNIKGAGVQTAVQLVAEAQDHFVATLAAVSDQTTHGRVYLLLEHLRGTRDATALRVYVGLPGAAASRQLAGRVGLYGLRRASAPQGGRTGDGLDFAFDVTSPLRQLLPTGAGPVSSLLVYLVPHHPLPDSTDLVLERVSFFRLVLP